MINIHATHFLVYKSQRSLEVDNTKRQKKGMPEISLCAQVTLFFRNRPSKLSL